MTEDADHFMYVCERYSRHRFELLQEINYICKTDFYSLKMCNWKLLTGQCKEIYKIDNEKIVRVVVKFIEKTGRFRGKK